MSPKGDVVETTASRVDFQLMAEMGGVVGRLSNGKIVKVWLLRPLDELYSIAADDARRVRETRGKLPVDVLMGMVAARKSTFREKLPVLVGGDSPDGERVYTGLWCYALKGVGWFRSEAAG
jgi:hypothetical protein